MIAEAFGYVHRAGEDALFVRSDIAMRQGSPIRE